MRYGTASLISIAGAESQTVACLLCEVGKAVSPDAASYAILRYPLSLLFSGGSVVIAPAQRCDVEPGREVEGLRVGQADSLLHSALPP